MLVVNDKIEYIETDVILHRSKRKVSECSTDSKKTAGLTISSKKSRKSPIRIRQVFRRSTSKGDDCTDCPNPPSPVATGALFGIPLSRLGDPDTIPRPVMVCSILNLLCLYKCTVKLPSDFLGYKLNLKLFVLLGSTVMGTSLGNSCRCLHNQFALR
jgi:hypothetical protein